MRAALLWCALAACGGGDAGEGPSVSDAAPPAPVPDAAAPVDAAPDDLDLALTDVRADLSGFTAVAGRSYRLKNPLGHEAEALAVARSPSGGTFPAGTIVATNPAEVMVKRRRGWNATTRDWEFVRIRFAADGSAEAFELRGAEETDCFPCHRDVSPPAFDLICDHP